MNLSRFATSSAGRERIIASDHHKLYDMGARSLELGAGWSMAQSVLDASLRRRAAGLRLSVGFILARRFTLCAFANFVDVLRLAADEGDRSRHIACDWKVISDSSSPIPSSSGIAIQPDEHLGDPARFDYIVVVGGLIDEIDGFGSEYTAYLRRAAALGYRWLASVPVPSCSTARACSTGINAASAGSIIATFWNSSTGSIRCPTASSSSIAIG
ncbi:hypothetical protein [Sphingomonas sp. DC3200b1]|uniref:hypothetical protein n=1 Tax=Sphingomonas sp. DC3200b1 TaxID=2804668 RepID=UPI003CED6F62